MSNIKAAEVKRRTITPPAKAIPVVKSTLNITKPGQATYLKLVLFGPPKTGKTTAACSGGGRKLLILTEPDGDLPLVGRDDIDVVRPENGVELQEIIRSLHAGAVANYEWVILDSVTFAFEIIGSELVNKTLEAKKDVRQAYGQVGASLVQMVHDLVSLKTNVVFTTQLRENFIDDDDPDAAGPEEGKYPFSFAVTPMVYKVLSPAVSVIGRTFKKMFVNAKGNKVSQFFVSFDDYGRSPAGSRIAVEDRYENLQLDTLQALLKGDSK